MYNRKNKGITLIALIITIIVLLILAGITITTLTDNNSVFSRTKYAKFLTEYRSVEEAVTMYKSSKVMEEYIQGITYTNLEKLPLGNQLNDAKKTEIKTNVPTLQQKIEEHSGKTIEETNLYEINKTLLGIDGIKNNYIIDVDIEKIYNYEGELVDDVRHHTVDEKNNLTQEELVEKVQAIVNNIVGKLPEGEDIDLEELEREIIQELGDTTIIEKQGQDGDIVGLPWIVDDDGVMVKISQSVDGGIDVEVYENENNDGDDSGNDTYASGFKWIINPEITYKNEDEGYVMVNLKVKNGYQEWAQTVVNGLPSDQTQRDAKLNEMFIQGVQFSEIWYGNLAEGTVFDDISDVWNCWGMTDYTYTSVREYYEEECASSDSSLEQWMIEGEYINPSVFYGDFENYEKYQDITLKCSSTSLRGLFYEDENCELHSCSNGNLPTTIDWFSGGYLYIYLNDDYTFTLTDVNGKTETEILTISGINVQEDNIPTNNEDEGIDMYGNPVDLSYWTYDFDGVDGSVRIRAEQNTVTMPAYIGDLEGGEIIGNIPAYIKEAGTSEFKPVTELEGALMGLDIITAPAIPETVTNMTSTFQGCELLQTAPVIPSSVEVLIYTFMNCKSLTGTLEINASTTNYTDMLYEASINNGTSLVLSGTSLNLSGILSTKSSNSNISLAE